MVGVSGISANSHPPRFRGFGHRVYKAEDPRAKYLKESSRALAENKGQLRWLNILDELIKTMAPLQAKGVYANVDFFAGSIYHLLGISEDLFIPIFALGRIPGCWSSSSSARSGNPRRCIAFTQKAGRDSGNAK